VTQPVDVQEFLQGFLGEADEHLGRVTGNLAAIEREPDRAHGRELAELLRSLHTLTGLAGMMGVDAVVDVAHAMESLVRAAERGGGRLPPAALDPLVEGAGAITQRIRALAEGRPVLPAPEQLLDRLERAADAPVDATPPKRARTIEVDASIAEKLTASEREELGHALDQGEHVVLVEFVPSPIKAQAGTTITTVRAGIARHGRIVRVVPRSRPRSDDAPGGLDFAIVVVTRAELAQLAADAGVDTSDVQLIGTAQEPDRIPAEVDSTPTDDGAFDRASRKGVVRMDVAKLDAALEHLSAIALGRARMRDEVQALLAGGLDLRRLRALLDDEGRPLRRMRETLLGLRMVPLREVLEPLPLIVRGLRNSTGKHVRLSVDVGTAELDKTVAERVFPALVHVVRNAVDHGIEAADVRAARGKPAEGQVRVEAGSTSAATIDITIVDDGGGIDAEAVARRAGKPVPASDAALLEILTTAGFSSRDETTTTSGRGIGLDIVRQTMDALGGSLELENRPGQGTTLRLRAPLTVAIVDAFAFESSHERYLAPIAVVDAIVEVEPSAVVRPPRRPGEAQPIDLLHARGDVIPLVSLRRALGLVPTGDETKAMIVRRAGHRFAFAIERMLGRHEVLVRPLADPLVKVTGVAGSADLGDGRPTLVLDLPGLTGRLLRAASTEAWS
jgi:two-component system chemotaxis sensor kinase CheA